VRGRCGKETVVMVVTMGAGEGRASERAVWEGDNGDGRDDGMWVSHGPRAVWEEDNRDGRDDGCRVSQDH